MGLEGSVRHLFSHAYVACSILAEYALVWRAVYYQGISRGRAGVRSRLAVRDRSAGNTGVPESEGGRQSIPWV